MVGFRDNNESDYFRKYIFFIACIYGIILLDLHNIFKTNKNIMLHKNAKGVLLFLVCAVAIVSLYFFVKKDSFLVAQAQGCPLNYAISASDGSSTTSILVSWDATGTGGNNRIQKQNSTGGWVDWESPLSDCNSTRNDSEVSHGVIYSYQLVGGDRTTTVRAGPDAGHLKPTFSVSASQSQVNINCSTNSKYWLSSSAGGTTMASPSAASTACPASGASSYSVNLNSGTLYSFDGYSQFNGTNSAAQSADYAKLKTPTIDIQTTGSDGNGACTPTNACVIITAYPNPPVGQQTIHYKIGANAATTGSFFRLQVGLGTTTRIEAWTTASSPWQQSDHTTRDHVVAANTKPTATSRTETITEDTAKTFTLNGGDADSDNVTFVVESPSEGSTSNLTQKTNTGTTDTATITYTPVANSNSAASFRFRTRDPSNVYSDYATVSLPITAVNDAPTASAATFTVNEGATYNGTLSGSDIEGSTLQYINGTTAPTRGTRSIFSNGAFSYSHNGSETTSDSFTFKVNDGSLTSENATVSVTITPVNDPPTASAQTVSATEDVAKAITLSGSDPEGSTLTYNISSTSGLSGKGSLTGYTAGVYNSGNRTVTFTPNADWNGTASFTFRVRDGSLNSTSKTVTINVAAVNDQPTASINGAPGSWTNSGTVKATISCSDIESGSNCDVYEYKVNSTNDCAGSWSSGSTTGNILSQSYVCGRVKDTNATGGLYSSNAGPTLFRVDRSNPTAAISGSASNWTSATTSASITCSDTGGSGCGTSRYATSNNASNNTPTCSSLSYGTNGSSVNITSPQWVCGKVWDGAGNTDHSSARYFKVDQQAPTGGIISGQAQNCTSILWSISGATDSGIGTLSHASGSYQFRRAFDNAWTNWGTSTTYLETGLSGETSYTNNARVRDTLGNASSEFSSGSVTTPVCDNVDPVVSASPVNSGGWIQSGTVITLSITDNIGVGTARYRWDAAASDTNGTLYTHGQTITSPVGSHRLYLWGSDTNGNTDVWSSVANAYQYDANDPTATLTVTSGGTAVSGFKNLDSVVLTYGGTDNSPSAGVNSGIALFRVFKRTAPLTAGNCGAWSTWGIHLNSTDNAPSTHTVTGLANNTCYEFRTWVRDNALRTGNEYSSTLKIDTTAPTNLSLTYNAAIHPNATASSTLSVSNVTAQDSHGLNWVRIIRRFYADTYSCSGGWAPSAEGSWSQQKIWSDNVPAGVLFNDAFVVGIKENKCNRYYAQAEDLAGNRAHYWGGFVQNDSIDPVCGVIPTEDQVTNTNCVFTLESASDSESGLVETSKSCEVAGLSEGQSGTCQLNLEDNAGNTAVCGESPACILDSVGPVLTATPSSKISNTAIPVTIGATDIGSGVALSTYRWGAAATSTSTPFVNGNANANITSSSTEGPYDLYVWARDNLGNTSTAIFGIYRVDKTPPSGFNITYSAAVHPNPTGASSIPMTGLTAWDAHGLDWIRVGRRIGPGGYTCGNQLGGYSYSTTKFWGTNIPAGAGGASFSGSLAGTDEAALVDNTCHHFYIEAQDLAGNKGHLYGGTVQQDSTAPTGSLSYPSGSNTTGTVDITYNVSDTPSGLNRVDVVAARTNFVNGSCGNNYTNVDPFPYQHSPNYASRFPATGDQVESITLDTAKCYKIQISAKDATPNWGHITPASLIIKVDTSLPVASITSSIGIGWQSESSTDITIDASDPQSGIDWRKYYKRSVPINPDGSCSWPADWSGVTPAIYDGGGSTTIANQNLTHGQCHQFLLGAKNNVNLRYWPNIVIKSDQQSPTCGAWSPSTNQFTTANSFTFTLPNATDPGESGLVGSNHGCTVTGGGAGTCSVTLVDNAGNSTNCGASPSVTIDPDPPVITATPDSALSDKGISVTLGVNDAISNVTSAKYIWDNATANAAKNSGTVFTNQANIISPSLPSGDHYLYVWAVDSAGNETAAQSFGPYQIDTTNPVVTITYEEKIHPNPAKLADHFITITATDNFGISEMRVQRSLNADAVYTCGNAWETGSTGGQAWLMQGAIYYPNSGPNETVTWNINDPNDANDPVVNLVQGNKCQKYRAFVEDTAGNRVWLDPNILVQSDFSPPTATFTYPAGGNSTGSVTATWSAADQPGGIRDTRIYTLEKTLSAGVCDPNSYLVRQPWPASVYHPQSNPYPTVLPAAGGTTTDTIALDSGKCYSLQMTVKDLSPRWWTNCEGRPGLNSSGTDYQAQANSCNQEANAPVIMVDTTKPVVSLTSSIIGWTNADSVNLNYTATDPESGLQWMDAQVQKISHSNGVCGNFGDSYPRIQAPDQTSLVFPPSGTTPATLTSSTLSYSDQVGSGVLEDGYCYRFRARARQSIGSTGSYDGKSPHQVLYVDKQSPSASITYPDGENITGTIDVISHSNDFGGSGLEFREIQKREVTYALKSDGRGGQPTLRCGDFSTASWESIGSTRSIAEGALADTLNNVLIPGNCYQFRLHAEDNAGNIQDSIDDGTVIVPNQPPVADDQSIAVDEDTSITITLVGNDPEGQPVTYSIASLPANGTVVGDGPEVLYTPTQDYNGLDSFEFRVADGAVNSNTATVSITVNEINDAPAPFTLIQPLDTSGGVSVTPLFEWNPTSDVDGDTISYRIFYCKGVGCSFGSGIQVNQNVSYTPAPLDPGSVYRWRVRATDDDQTPMSWTTSAWSFTTSGPPAVSVSLPSSTGIIGNEYIYTFSATDPDNDAMRVAYATDKEVVVDASNIGTTSWRDIPAQVAGGGDETQLGPITTAIAATFAESDYAFDYEFSGNYYYRPCSEFLNAGQPCRFGGEIWARDPLGTNEWARDEIWLDIYRPAQCSNNGPVAEGLPITITLDSPNPQKTWVWPDVPDLTKGACPNGSTSCDYTKATLGVKTVSFVLDGPGSDDEPISCDVEWLLAPPADPVWNNVAFNDPNMDLDWSNVANEVGYNVRRVQPDSGVWTVSVAADTTATQDDTVGSREGSYQYTVEACNATGCSSQVPSPVVEVNFPPTCPATNSYSVTPLNALSEFDPYQTSITFSYGESIDPGGDSVTYDVFVKNVHTQEEIPACLGATQESCTLTSTAFNFFKYRDTSSTPTYEWRVVPKDLSSQNDTCGVQQLSTPIVPQISLLSVTAYDPDTGDVLDTVFAGESKVVDYVIDYEFANGQQAVAQNARIVMDLSSSLTVQNISDPINAVLQGTRITWNIGNPGPGAAGRLEYSGETLNTPGAIITTAQLELADEVSCIVNAGCRLQNRIISTVRVWRRTAEYFTTEGGSIYSRKTIDIPSNATATRNRTPLGLYYIISDNEVVDVNVEANVNIRRFSAQEFGTTNTEGLNKLGKLSIGELKTDVSGAIGGSSGINSFGDTIKRSSSACTVCSPAQLFDSLDTGVTITIPDPAGNSALDRRYVNADVVDLGGKVYVLQAGKSLVVSNPLIIRNSADVDVSGAGTIIIEEGDLIIEEEIVYDIPLVPVTASKQLASVAWVIQNGNVTIEEDPSLWLNICPAEGAPQISGKGRWGCNPYWPELEYLALEKGQAMHGAPETVSGIFYVSGAEADGKGIFSTGAGHVPLVVNGIIVARETRFERIKLPFTD